MSDTLRLAAYRRVPTRKGDSLQRIAAREMGDASRWPDLAEINNLLPPYLTEDPALAGERVLLIGMEIQVPAPAGPATGTAAGGDAADVLGKDLALPDGKLRIENGRFVTVSGRENMSQAARHVIDTRPAELLFHLSYGCHIHDLKGAPVNSVTHALAAAFVGQSLRADPRIDRTEGLVGSAEGDGIAVRGTAITVDGKRVTVGQE